MTIAWSDIYRYLNDKYQLHDRHKLPFWEFMQNSEANQRWIPIYFANPIWFKNRPNTCVIHLKTFLQQPEMIIGALFNRAEPELPKLCRFKTLRDQSSEIAGQLLEDRLVADKTGIAFCNGYIERFSHHQTIGKYKTRGAHV